jgi:DNA polymerase-1
LGIKQSEAKVYIEKYFEQYPQVAQWIDQTVELAVARGYTTTLWGRRRYIPELQEKNRTLFELGKRVAINSPIQGTSAEIMKLAMIQVDQVLKKHKLKSRLVLQIHDELVLQVPDDEKKAIESIICPVMESIVDWEVPFKVSAHLGKDWGSLK